MDIVQTHSRKYNYCKAKEAIHQDTLSLLGWGVRNDGLAHVERITEGKQNEKYKFDKLKMPAGGEVNLTRINNIVTQTTYNC